MEPVSRLLSLVAVGVTVLFPLVYAAVLARGAGFACEASSVVFALFFVIGMSLMTVVVVSSFDHPPFMRDGSLTDHFVTRFSLSRSETQIVEFILDDHDNKSIADDLGISVRTVENHLHSVYGKTGVGSRGELARFVRSSM